MRYWVLGVFLGALVQGAGPAHAQVSEIWLDTGEVVLTSPSGEAVVLRPGQYARCDAEGCVILPQSGAPGKPFVTEQGAVLPAPVAAALVAASTPEEVAALIEANPDLAGPILGEALALGIVTPEEAQALAGEDIETADIAPTGTLRRNFGRVPSFVNLPSESQASPN